MTVPVTDLDWRVLVDSLARGNCVALLGPDLRAASAAPAAPTLVAALSNRLAQILVDEERISVDAPDDFPLVAQLFVDRKSRTDLEVVVTDFYEGHDASLKQEKGKDAVFESLAALPFQLFVSSRHDLTLEHYLTEAQRPPLSMSYNFRGNQQITIGAGRTNGQPLVYHLFGSVSDPGSLALTQRDLLDVLQAIVSGNPALPTDLRNQFKEKSFLFVGCGLHNYYLRILLHVLGLNRSGQRSFALEAANQESVWFYKVEYRTLKLLDMEATPFVTELQRRWTQRPRTGNGDTSQTVVTRAPPKERPRVFISYMREDEPWTEKLKESLDQNNIEAWRDIEGLQFADRWPKVIDDVIGKQVDFFIVLLSRHLDEGTDTYVHLEIRRALQRRLQRGAVKFIYPLMIEEGAHRLKSLDDEEIQSSRLQNFDVDVAELAKDIRREYAKIQRR